MNEGQANNDSRNDNSGDNRPPRNRRPRRPRNQQNNSGNRPSSDNRPSSSRPPQRNVPMYLSVIVPVFNEEENVTRLYDRLKKTLDEKVRKPYEIIFIDDGSVDRSLFLLREILLKDGKVRVIEFNRNYGQHAAIFAGFDKAQGEVVVTIDADLQNPPEEIPKLLEKIDQGYDVVGGWREMRKDPIFRKCASWVVNRLMSWAIGIKMHDYGCMLRAYRKEVVQSVVKCNEIASFIPALANSFAKKMAEVRVAHDERQKGTSKYSLFKLIKLNFDLMTGFSLLPIQAISLAGFFVFLVGVGFGSYLLYRHFFTGVDVDLFGAGAMMGVLSIFIGVVILSLGIIGEYIARIYMEVRRRPRYFVKKFYRR